jgi:hypothetical protein
MLMRNWIWMLAVLVALSFGAALSAQESKPEKAPEGEEKEGEKEGEKAEEEDYLAKLKAQFKDVDKVVGTVTVTDADIKSYEKYEQEFDDFVDSDAKFEELSDKSLKEAFDYAITSEKYLAWAKARSLSAEDWLRKACRIMIFSVRDSLGGPGMEEQIKSLKEMKTEMEKLKDQLSAEEYKESMDQIDKSIAQLEGMRDFGKSLPAPTEAEAALLKKTDEEDSKDEDGEDKDDMD